MSHAGCRFPTLRYQANQNEKAADEMGDWAPNCLRLESASVGFALWLARPHHVACQCLFSEMRRSVPRRSHRFLSAQNRFPYRCCIRQSARIASCVQNSFWQWRHRRFFRVDVLKCRCVPGITGQCAHSHFGHRTPAARTSTGGSGSVSCANTVRSGRNAT